MSTGGQAEGGRATGGQAAGGPATGGLTWGTRGGAGPGGAQTGGTSTAGGATIRGGAAGSGGAGPASAGGGAAATASGGKSSGGGGLAVGGIDSGSNQATVAADGCTGKPDGSYCGANLTPPGKENNLYKCVLGKTESFTPCTQAYPATCDASTNHCVAVPGALTESSAAATAAKSCTFFDTSTCGTCANAKCCDEEQLCFGSSDCLALWNCVAACAAGNQVCVNACIAAHPNSLDAVNAVNLCARARCTTECEVDPCSFFPLANGNGLSCGSNLSPGTPPDVFYACANYKTDASVRCVNGCFAAPLGKPDYCIGSDPCATCPYDGAACGANLPPNGNPSLLYQCKAQRTVSTSSCTFGCFAAPPGQADHCN